MVRKQTLFYFTFVAQNNSQRSPNIPAKNLIKTLFKLIDNSWDYQRNSFPECSGIRKSEPGAAPILEHIN